MMTLGSPFEALRKHTPLVVTISEEKQLFERNLKVIMSRVNAATSLLKWARGEGNPCLRGMVEKLYDVILMWSTVQKQFSEQCLQFSKALESVLQVEQGLDAIKKQHRATKEKVDGLHKQIELMKRKSDATKFREAEEELFKYTSEEEELAAELQVKFIKAEIFKTKVLKASLLELTSTYSENADKLKFIANASTSIVHHLPDIPTYLSTESKEKDHDTREHQGMMKDLAKDLGLNYHASPDQKAPPFPASFGNETKQVKKSPPEDKGSGAKTAADQKTNQETKAKNRLSRLPNFHIPRLKKNKQKEKNPHTDQNIEDQDNFVIISPVQNTPPNFPASVLTDDIRRRTQSSNFEVESLKRNRDRELKQSGLADEPSNRNVVGDGVDDNNDVIDDDSDDCNAYEDPDYIEPNLYQDLRPNHVTEDVNSKTTLPNYSEPLDKYDFPWIVTSDSNIDSEPIYDVPYDAEYDETTERPDSVEASKTMLESKGNPPPKPQRGRLADALYINSNDVERLLNEVYGDPQLTKTVKPEVKRKALNKIKQEKRLQDETEVLELRSDEEAVGGIGRTTNNFSIVQRPRPHSGIFDCVESNSSNNNEASFTANKPTSPSQLSDESQCNPKKDTHSARPPTVPARPKIPRKQPQSPSNEAVRNEAEEVLASPRSKIVPQVVDKISKPRVPPRPAHP